MESKLYTSTIALSSFKNIETSWRWLLRPEVLTRGLLVWGLGAFSHSHAFGWEVQRQRKSDGPVSYP